MHAKVCVVDDTWATIGSDNFNRRSWTHDSELSAVVVDQGRTAAYARRLRLTLAAEHLDRAVDDPDALLEVMADCVEPAGHVRGVRRRRGRPRPRGTTAAGSGARPPGRLRRLQPPELGRVARALALVPYLTPARPRRAAPEPAPERPLLTPPASPLIGCTSRVHA